MKYKCEKCDDGCEDTIPCFYEVEMPLYKPKFCPVNGTAEWEEVQE